VSTGTVSATVAETGGPGAPGPAHRSRRTAPIRAVLRFLGAVAMVSGALLVADAAATLIWQEPVSALLAGRAQARLGQRLLRSTAAVAVDRRRVAREPHPRRRLATMAARYGARLRTGDPVGRIRLPTLGRSYVVVQGTDTGSLREGPGHYPSTPFPGQRGTVAVAGHRTTYGAPFRPIDQLRPGDPVTMVMPYGRFTYRVQYTRIVMPTALWVTNRVGYDRLILSACHPLYSAARRIVVFARLARAEPA